MDELTFTLDLNHLCVHDGEFVSSSVGATLLSTQQRAEGITARSGNEISLL